LFSTLGSYQGSTPDRRTIARHLPILVLVLVAAGPGLVVAQSVARVEVSPAAAMLTQQGETRQVHATAYDANGVPLAAAIEWSSSDPSAVDVDQSGQLVANVAVGSALIVARVGSVVSEPLLAYVAVPPAGALLFDDSQLVAGPTWLDFGPAGSILGARIEAVLSGIVAPAVGTMVLPLGETRLAGRVVATESLATGVRLELEIPSIADMFEEIDVDQSFDLDPVITTNGAVFRDGFESGATTAWDAVAGMTRSESSPIDSRAFEFDLGPFECSSSANVSLPAPTIDYTLTVDPSPTFDVHSQGGTLLSAEVRVDATVSARLHGEIRVPGQLAASVGCDATLFIVVLPPGPFGVVMSPKLPIGLGFKLDGQVEVELARLLVTGDLGATATVGMRYEMGQPMQDLSDFTITSTPEVMLDGLDDPAEDLRFAASMYVYGRLGLWIGPALVPTVGLEVLSSKLGIKASLDLAGALGQAVDPAYASTYQLDFRWEVAAGPELQQLWELIGLNQVVTLSANGEVPISRSPLGAWSAPAAAVRPGNAVDLTIDLTETDFLATYNVESVQIYELTSDVVGGDALTPLVTISTVPGQTQVTWQWTPSESDVGDHTFVATTKTHLIPPRLEIANDSQLAVTVENSSVIDGDVWVWTQADADALDGVIEITGNLTIRPLGGVDHPTDLSPLASLTTIGRGLVISDNPNLASLSGMDAIQTVGGDLEIANNDALTVLDGLGALISVGEGVVVEGNDLLTSLTGPSALATVGGTVSVRGSSLSNVTFPALLSALELNVGEELEGVLQTGSFPVLQSASVRVLVTSATLSLPMLAAGDISVESSGARQLDLVVTAPAANLDSINVSGNGGSVDITMAAAHAHTTSMSSTPKAPRSPCTEPRRSTTCDSSTIQTPPSPPRSLPKTT
jgi:hypothetical protein